MAAFKYPSYAKLRFTPPGNYIQAVKRRKVIAPEINHPGQARRNRVKKGTNQSHNNWKFRIIPLPHAVQTIHCPWQETEAPRLSIKTPLSSRPSPGVFFDRASGAHLLPTEQSAVKSPCTGYVFTKALVKWIPSIGGLSTSAQKACLRSR